MSLLDEFRACADFGRAVADDLGVRTTTVTIRLETWSAPIDTAGATVVSTQDTVLSPSPKVRDVGEGVGSYFGDGNLAASTGVTRATTYAIGPITQTYSAGGYTPGQIAPPITAPTQRALVLLAGDEFTASGEVFEITAIDATRPHQITLTVQRTRQ